MAHLLYFSCKYSKLVDMCRAVPDSRYCTPASAFMALAGDDILTEGKVQLWKRPAPPVMPAEDATSSPATRIGVLSVALWMSLTLTIMITIRTAGRTANQMILMPAADT